MKKIYQKSIDEIYKELNTQEKGLSNLEAKKRIKTDGLNILIDKNKRTKLQIFLSQFKNMMIILLLVVGVLSLIYSLCSYFLVPIFALMYLLNSYYHILFLYFLVDNHYILNL